HLLFSLAIIPTITLSPPIKPQGPSDRIPEIRPSVCAYLMIPVQMRRFGHGGSARNFAHLMIICVPNATSLVPLAVQEEEQSHDGDGNEQEYGRYRVDLGRHDPAQLAQHVSG